MQHGMFPIKRPAAIITHPIMSAAMQMKLPILHPIRSTISEAGREETWVMI
jgi:hypothetical protein